MSELSDLHDQFALLAGITLGVLIGDKEKNRDLIMLVLELPAVREIAKANPGRLVDGLYRGMQNPPAD